MHAAVAAVLVVLSYCTVQTMAQTASELRALGDAALASNDLKGALTHYSKLIEVEPSKAMNYYKRAGILLRQRAYAKVLPDLNLALTIDPKFVEGYLHRAKIYGIRGECADARKDLETVLKLKPGQSQATKQLPEMDSCMTNMNHATDLAARGDCNSANYYADLAMKTAIESTKLLLVKAQCALNAKDYHAVISQTRTILSGEASNLDALAFRGAAYYGLGENDAAINHFREGLRLDPEHKLMKSTYKKLRALQKHLQNGDSSFDGNAFADAAESFEDALAVDPEHPIFALSLHTKLCRTYQKLKKGDKCLASCNRVLQLDNNNFDGYLLRGECHLILEKGQDALNDFQRAQQMNQQDQRVHDGLRRAQLEIKKASRKDYYKVLGVAKDADSKAIKKAFRKLALENHPDKQENEEERKKAEIAFREYTEAYEVLGTDENRQKYDAGEDININEQNMNQHFHHFQQAGGFGGQQFHFRFN